MDRVFISIAYKPHKYVIKNLVHKENQKPLKADKHGTFKGFYSVRRMGLEPVSYPLNAAYLLAFSDLWTR